MANFLTERDGQIDFYSTFLPRIDPNLQLDDILADNNDGVLRGNLLEFKLNVSDLNAVLFQCVKYLSARRIKGKPIPANIIIVDLNSEIAYQYCSVNYLSDIETVYIGAASKGNKGFVGKPYDAQYQYGKKQVDAAKLISVLKTEGWTKIHINEDCVVGWAKSYYDQNPTARKEDFVGDSSGKHRTLGEIRNPVAFRDYIYPYRGRTNARFNYLMDKLNDPLLRKNIGAFYTPEIYAKKSHELLRQAIERVPEGNDYIILDRCAGTGNLELFLTDDELSHCVLSTVEYYEYKVLVELIGAKVRHIIPPTETSTTFNKGYVNGADALTREYINNPVIRQYIDNPKCTVILFENPPYAETTSAEHQRKGQSARSSQWKNKFVVREMKQHVKGTVTNDLGNIFIWSGFHYYLRQPTDSYVVYSPCKYWKAQHLVNKKLIGAFCFNRLWFHTKINACILCALWANEDDMFDEFEAEGFDFDPDAGTLVSYGMLPIKRIHSKVSKMYYDKRPIPDSWRSGVLCALNGTEHPRPSTRNKPAVSDEILGYMVAHSSGFDNPDLDSSLLVGGRYDGNGFYLRRDNFLEKMPLFCMSRYITYNRQWTERSRIMKSGDGAAKFNADASKAKRKKWLRKCLLFTCLETQNHMRTFIGSDKQLYRNELCLDTTNGDTAASLEIAKMTPNKAERTLLDTWNNLLAEIKKTKEYNIKLTYGVFQIAQEIDTFYKDEQGRTVYNNVQVHTLLQTLKQLLKAYYKKEIVPTLFRYEFLK